MLFPPNNPNNPNATKTKCRGRPPKNQVPIIEFPVEVQPGAQAIRRSSRIKKT